MAKINETYEAVVVFSSKAGEDAVKDLTAKFNEMIEANAKQKEIMYCGISQAKHLSLLSLSVFSRSQTELSVF